MTTILRLIIFVLIFQFQPVTGCGQTDRSENEKWLLITTSQLVESIKPLIEKRKQQGYDVRMLVRDPANTTTDWTSEAITDWIKNQTSGADVVASVLLVGNWRTEDVPTFVPTGKGQFGRMAGRLSDHVYSLPNKKGIATIAVGRLPARSAADATGMVDKIARFEDQSCGEWTNRINLWVGHPGGNSVVEKKLGEAIVQSAIGGSLNKIHPMWHAKCLVNFPNTRYSVDRETFVDSMRSDLAAGTCFTVYAGHSGANGLWSEDQIVLDRTSWKRVKIKNSPGVFISTGCYSCQAEGVNGEGFLVAAMRNPNGPASCIGAYGESYAAHGQLAIDALVRELGTDSPPTRLRDYWLSVQRGIGSGTIDPLRFWLYDQADGSHGKVPLMQQRLEHLEMWTLFGDPAMQIPIIIPSLKLDVKGAATGSNKIVLTCAVPGEVSDAKAIITYVVKRSKSSSPSPTTADEAGGGNETSPAPIRIPLTGNLLVQKWLLPKPLPNGTLDIRVLVTDQHLTRLGVATLKIRAPSPQK